MGAARKWRRQSCSSPPLRISLRGRFWRWMEVWGFSSLRGRGIDDRSDLGNTIRREASLAGMFADELLVGRIVDAVDLVIGDIAVHPLNLGAEVLEYTARFLRDALQLFRRKLSGARQFALDHVFGH